MTVQELIAFLADKPLDMEVMVNGYEMYYKAPEKIEVAGMWYIGPHPYSGDHNVEPPWNDGDTTPIPLPKNVVLISR